MNDFEAVVLADLSLVKSDMAVLKNQMASLMGAGQPGRLYALEERLDQHERGIQHTKGSPRGLRRDLHVAGNRGALHSGALEEIEMTIQGRGEVLAIAIPAVLVAGFLVFAGYGWLQEHDARVKAEAQTGQQQKQIDGLKQEQVDTQNVLTEKLAALEKARQAPATATQLVSDASTLLPGLPAPLQVQTAPNDPKLPDAPPAQTVVIPEADFKSIQNAQINCEESAAKLTACQTLSNESKQQLQLTEQQRDEWKTAAKGGSMCIARWVLQNGSPWVPVPERTR